jgi:class 3 adenylate cyclase
VSTVLPDLPSTTVPAAPPAVAPPRAQPKRPWRLPLFAWLALAFVSLAVVSGAAYLIVLTGATGTAERLLVGRTERVVESQVALIQSRLDPITDQLELLASLSAAGRIDINVPVDVREALAVAMTRMPAVSAIAFGTLDLQLHRAIRHPDGVITRDTVKLSELPHGLERFRKMATSHETFWGELFWNSVLKQPVLNVRTPVRRNDDAFVGALIATVAVGDLSALIGDPENTGGRYFILVDHDRVLAHRRLIDPRGLGLTADSPLPSIKEVEDPILAHIWDPPVRSARMERALGDLGHVVSVDGRSWVFVYRSLPGYGPQPWLVGQYFPLEDATADLDRLTNGALVGAATLAVAVLLAIAMGLGIGRAIRTITTAAEAVERLDFEQPVRRGSRVRELDDAGQSLEKALGALKWFRAYVPQRLVFRLMEHGEEALRSRRRNVTVMFTDIVEFTPQAEDLPEQETADLLNHHFALLGTCIDKEGGVIDKYIGDAVMAVWGGISHADDHAAAAIRAALAIARVVREDNALRRANGQSPIRMRIGLHSGPVVMGNIGAPSRVNFTVVGDTVNVAQRFEQLGKEFMKPEDDIVILASGSTLASVKDLYALGLSTIPALEHRTIKGHENPVEVYRLS